MACSVRNLVNLGSLSLAIDCPRPTSEEIEYPTESKKLALLPNGSFMTYNLDNISA